MITTWLTRRETVGSVGHVGRVWGLVCSRSGKYMESKSGKGSRASVGDDEGGCVLPAGRRLLNAHIGSLKDLKVVQRGDRSLLISCDEIGHYGLWDLNGPCTSPACFVKGAHSASINSLAVMEVASLLVTASDDTTMRLWDLTKMCIDSSPVVEMTGHSSFVSACACATDSPVIASCSLDSTIRLWDPRSPGHIFLYNVHTPASTVRFIPGTTTLLVSASSEGLFFWDIRVHKSYKEVFNAIEADENENSGQSSVPSSPARKISIPATPTKTPHRSSSSQIPPQTPNRNTQIQWDTPQGNYFCSNRSTKRVFDKLSRTFIQPFTGHTAPCYSVIPSSDGRHVLSSSTDNTHKLWEASKFTGEFTFDGADLSTQIQPAFSSDDKYIACGSADGFVYIWESFSGADASAPLKGGRRFSGNHLQKIPPFSRETTFSITSNCWLPADTGIAFGDTSGTIHIIELF